jgi:hypothetical protein
MIMCAGLPLSVTDRVSRKRVRETPIPVTPKQKRVRFQEAGVILVCPAPSPLERLDSVDEWADVWYGQEDVAEFHGEARNLCRMMRECNVASKTEEGEHANTPLLAKDTLTRGLEQRTCRERQRRKLLATRLIVQAANDKMRHNPDQLAELAQRCNAWATALAIQEAERDHFRATDDEYAQQEIILHQNALRSKCEL